MRYDYKSILLFDEIIFQFCGNDKGLICYSLYLLKGSNYSDYNDFFSSRKDEFIFRIILGERFDSK